MNLSVFVMVFQSMILLTMSSLELGILTKVSAKVLSWLVVTLTFL